VTATSSLVTLDSPKRFLNELAITATTPAADAPPTAVLLHGYGAGLGFFFQNFPALGAWVGRRGGALSARVPFSITAPRADTPARVAQAEAFFVDALEEWRAARGIARMQLYGHSLGGYLAAAYALRHPDRVARLVLISPAGIPRDPADALAPARELTESQDESIRGPAGAAGANVGGGNAAKEATRPAVERVRSEQKAVGRKNQSRTRQLFMYLWEEGWSPFQVVRSIGVWGPLIIGKVGLAGVCYRLNLTGPVVLVAPLLGPHGGGHARYARLHPADHARQGLRRVLHMYVAVSSTAKHVPDAPIAAHILAPGAHARMPMVDRIGALKIPVTFICMCSGVAQNPYSGRRVIITDGEHDWMDAKGGYKSVENLRAAGNQHGRMFIVPNSGHHGERRCGHALRVEADAYVTAVYLDNPQAVNDLLVKELDAAT
jgi:cardiolipin-specific phospholipase